MHGRSRAGTWGRDAAVVLLVTLALHQPGHGSLLPVEVESTVRSSGGAAAGLAGEAPLQVLRRAAGSGVQSGGGRALLQKVRRGWR
jgi:hypothetical protein